MRALVTGGAGFIGSHLCDRLVADGHEVTCLDDLSTGSLTNVERGHFELRVGDVRKASIEGFDRVYHLACPASPVQYQRDPVRTARTCIEGTLHVLDRARASGARVLLASTSEVYGDPDEHPQRESYWGRVNPVGPRACYDEGKRAAEMLAAVWGSQYGVDVRVARIFNTYGPRLARDDGRVVSAFITRALDGLPIPVAEGAQTRSFCYVDDTVDGLVRLMESDVQGAVNIGDPREEVSIAELARRVCAAVGVPARVVEVPLPVDDPRRRCPDIGRAMRLLGWEPRVDLDEGLRRTVDYFRAAWR